jgi:large subunit ribosomal protein L9
MAVVEVILQKDVPGLGTAGDLKKIAGGYAQFLKGKGQVILATRENRVALEERRIELKQDAAARLQEAKARAANLQDLKISWRVVDQDRLYGSIGEIDLAHAFVEKGVGVTKQEIHLPDGPIRHTGEHQIVLRLHSEVHVPLKVIVIPAV